MLHHQRSWSIGRFLDEEDGPTAVEYAVMLALIIAASILAINTFGGGVAGNFQNSTNCIINASKAASGSG